MKLLAVDGNSLINRAFREHSEAFSGVPGVPFRLKKAVWKSNKIKEIKRWEGVIAVAIYFAYMISLFMR